MERKRIGFFDEVRGFAIICMVVYHVLFDLKYFHGVNVPIFFDGWFDIIRDIFAGTFIFISGCVCRFSRNNLKRGVQCFFLGMLVTFVSAFVSPEAPIYFGILHMLGISMMLFGLLEKFLDAVPIFPAMTVFLILFALCFNIPRGYIGFDMFSIELPREIYNAKLLFPLGFQEKAFYSVDYFPLLPWFFLFIAGSCFGVYVQKGSAPRFFYKTHVGFLAAAGRHTIWIYLLHQPIAYVVLNLIFKGSIF